MNKNEALNIVIKALFTVEMTQFYRSLDKRDYTKPGFIVNKIILYYLDRYLYFIYIIFDKYRYNFSNTKLIIPK